MIVLKGYLAPTREQVAHVRRWADGSFCASSSEAFMSAGFPTFDGWVPAEKTATLLRLKNVEPHDDPWVSCCDSPPVRRAIFWLLAGGHTFDRKVIHFGCGAGITSMQVGDFVVFDDSVTHWVMSDKVWRGAAIQLKEVA